MTHFSAWIKTDCDSCGCSFQVTRSEPKDVDVDINLLCPECSAQEDAHHKGVDDGRASASSGNHASLDVKIMREIAKLEGRGSVMSACGNALFVPVNGSLYSYNPITDLAINCGLRDKYKVSVNWDRDGSLASVSIEGHCRRNALYAEEIPRAVCESILIYKGIMDATTNILNG